MPIRVNTNQVLWRSTRPTGERETPEVTNVRHPHEQCQAGHLETIEEHAVADEFDLDLLENAQVTLLISRTNEVHPADL